MNIKKNQTVSIGEAAKLCGVTVKKIRHWQTRGFIPEPQRVVCGERAYRQFDDDDLLIIRKIKGYLDAGFRLDVAAEKAATDILIEKGGPKNA
jgi:DNA-binding transcriptional MerR regulator